MFHHERALKCLKLFVKWIGSQIAHDQNLADYTPADAEQKLHVAVNKWLDANLNEVNPRSGDAFRHCCFSSVTILKGEETPFIIIETKGGAMRAFITPVDGELGSKSHRDYLVGYLEDIAVKKSDIHIYETGTMCDCNIGINITGETAKFIFEQAGISNQVKMATEKALSDRKWKKAEKPTTLVSL